MNIFCDGSKVVYAGWAFVDENFRIRSGANKDTGSKWAEIKAAIEAVKSHDGDIDLFTDFKPLVVWASYQKPSPYTKTKIWKEWIDIFESHRSRHRLKIHKIRHGDNQKHVVADALARKAAHDGVSMEIENALRYEDLSTLILTYGKRDDYL